LEGEGTVYTAVPDGNIPECIWMQLRFSPDGQWLVGNSYASALNSYRVSDFPAFLGSTLEPTWSSGESGCPTLGSLPSGYPSPIEADGDASRWPSFTGASSLEPFDSGGRHPYDDLAYSPDGQNSVMTLRCEAEGTDGQCEARLSSQRWDESNVPPTLSQFPSFDPTSHWIVAGSTLVHVPSGDVRELNPDAAVALFAPNGDIFVGERDSSLVRYCRTPAAP
jgi:hypothetical protein